MKYAAILFGLCLAGCPGGNPIVPEPFCGDGAQDANEECDDGNNAPNDGCDAQCVIERCGDNITNGAEQCDDGANIDGDGCSAQCQTEFCGDGDVNNNTEECDDGATVDGDGCSANCVIEPPSGQLSTFLVDSLTVPINDGQSAIFGSDYNGDGVINDRDNSLGDLNAAMENLGIDIQVGIDNAINDGVLLYGFDVTADDLINDTTVSVLSYLAALFNASSPSFDGSDVLIPTSPESLLQGGNIANSRLRAGPSDFLFGLPLDPINVTILPMENTIIEANISAVGLTTGKLTGTISATDFAPITQDIALQINALVQTEAQNFGGGVAIQCQDDTPCQASGGVCTDRNGDAEISGVCISPNAPVVSILALADADQDGIIEVTFDNSTGTFIENEVALFFDITRPGGAPIGIIGNLFRLDLDQNGDNDAIGFGVGLTAVSATRQ
jgi:cysteine-rich repeat protein